MKTIRVPLFLTGSLLMILLVACTPSSNEQEDVMHIDISQNGSTIHLQPGQELLVSLETNPTTGYSWMVLDPGDDQVITQHGEADYEPLSSDQSIDGAGGTVTYHFLAGSAGSTTLQLGYGRAWETNEPPVQIFEIYIEIQ